jgi:Spondin_N
MFKKQTIAATLAISSLFAITNKVSAATIRVTVENLAPQNGVFVTPLWVGFHDGGFDALNENQTASGAIERIAEDGDATFISNDFTASGFGLTQGVIRGGTIPPIAPAEKVSATFNLDGNLASSRYLSYAAMIVPSNDAFIANDDALEHRIFDDNGKFLGADFTILGSEVLDAGTEVNNEAVDSTAFFGQTIPNTGITENGVIHTHLGFIPNGRILSEPRFANVDFTANGYQILRVRVDRVPESSTILGLLAIGGLSWLSRSRHKDNDCRSRR